MLTATRPQHEEYSLRRRRSAHQGADSRWISLAAAPPCLNFTSNDYLGLARHPDVIAALQQAAQHWGFGSGSSALISGYSQTTADLEQRFAQWQEREAALFFNSGYQANLAVLSCFASRHHRIIADKAIHASLLDGAALSRAKLQRFAHNSPEQAKQLLADSDTPALLVSESVYSMAGDIAPIDDYRRLASQYGATLLVDDAHGLGILGDDGRGAVSHFHADQQTLPLLVTPFGKAMGGMGAMVSGSSADIDHLLQHARSYRYTTALPPAVPAALHQSLTALVEEHWRRRQLQANIHQFLDQARSRNIPLVASDATPIMAVPVGDNQRTLEIQAALRQTGIYVSAIRPPTVPRGCARLRITLSSLHQPADIKRLISSLEEYL